MFGHPSYDCGYLYSHDHQSFPVHRDLKKNYQKSCRGEQLSGDDLQTFQDSLSPDTFCLSWQLSFFVSHVAAELALRVVQALMQVLERENNICSLCVNC